MCGHTGKWTGSGQSIVNMGTSIMIISTSVCGECGQSVISVNKINITPTTPKDDILKPDRKLHLPPRFSKKN